MTHKPMKCFLVEGNHDPEDTMLVFETSSIAAKRRWANEHGDGDRYIAGISAARRKEWDQYAPGPVPALVLIDAGWAFECCGCATQISADYIGGTDRSHFDVEEYDLDREYGPDYTLPVMEPVEEKAHWVFCTAECRDEYLQERRRIRTMERRAGKLLRARVLQRFPDASFAIDDRCWSPWVSVMRHPCGALLVHDARITFLGPGMKHGAHLRIDDEKWRRERTKVSRNRYPYERHLPLPLSARERRVEWSCAYGDQDAFKAWASATKPATAEAAA